MRVLVVIPAYNEAGNIERVVQTLRERTEYDYVVVNDGSKDNTAEICKRNGFCMVDLPINLGLAGAFQAGMLYAYNNDYDYAIQFDGDGQHDPQYIGSLVEAACMNHWQVTVGSRYVKEKKPFSPRMIGSRIIQLCIKMTTGKTIHDPTSGMRLYDKSMIRLMAKTMNYSPEPDTLAFLLRCGISMGETQVQMSDRVEGVSYLNLSNTIKYMFNVCTSILLVQWFRKKIDV